MRMLVCYEEILMVKKPFSRQISVLDFFKSSSRAHASPPVGQLLDSINDDPDDLPTVRGNASSLKCHLFVIFIFFVNFSYVCIFFWSKQTVWNNPPNFNIAFMGKCVSTNVAGIGTTDNVTSGCDLVL
jgi:hypothetical protein